MDLAILSRASSSKLWKDTVLLRLFGWTKIPLLGFIQPRVRHMDADSCVIEVPLSWRTRNHLRSMYFGVLSAGADLAGGLLAMRIIQGSGKNVSLVFKDFKADFLKRAESRTLFVCHEGAQVRAFLDRVLASPDRQEMPVHVEAHSLIENKWECVARFTLTLSLKNR